MDPRDLSELKRLCKVAVTRRQHELSSCRGKSRFETRADAASTLRDHEKRRKVAPYHCNVCGGWHVGSTEHKRAKRVLEKRRSKRRLTQLEKENEA